MNWLRKTAASLTLLGAFAWCAALDYVALDQALDRAKSNQNVQRTLKEFKVAEKADATLSTQAGAVSNVPVPTAEDVKAIRDGVKLRAVASGAAGASVDVSKIKRLKQSPLYNDPGAKAESNWLQKSVESLGEWIRNLFRQPERRESTGGPSGFALPDLFTFFVWAGIIGISGLALAFAASLIARRKAKTKVTTALVSDEEAALTLDEWLSRAEALSAAGEFREAVRCLYVACLLRLDQAGYLEFRRFETNWEHYNRYRDKSGMLPFDLLHPTQRFDRIWYGNQVRGRVDADEFKTIYSGLVATLKQHVRAA